MALIRASLRSVLKRHDPHGQIAQLVEQRIENPCVDSSILSLATIFYFEVFTNP